MSTRASGRLTTGMTITMFLTDCANCGVVFAVTDTFDQKRRTDGQTFYCPNGHPLTYGENDLDQERKARKRAEQRANDLARDRDSLRWHLDHERKSKAAYKGQLTKVKNRVKNGVCPCCNRTFVNLQRHMQSQHPGWHTEPQEEA